MNDETSITVVDSIAELGVRRGLYLNMTMQSAFVFAKTQRHRVTGVSRSAVTLRHVHRFAVAEWCRARAEDWILWPLEDLHRRFRVRT